MARRARERIAVGGEQAIPLRNRQRLSQPPRSTRLAPVTPDVVVSVNDAVTRALREAILGGTFRPGERLVQDELATELNVSRQPVRDALRRLESEGLVVQLPHRGFMVRQYSEQDVRQNYHLRQLLESEAARLAAKRIQPDELEALKAINRAMMETIAARDSTRLVELNAQFHNLVRESARMPGLVRLINQLWVGLTVLTPLFLPGRASRSVQEHQALIAALQERNPRKAAAAMQAHIGQASAEYFSQKLQPGDGPTAPR